MPPMSEATKRKISKANKGRVFSEEHKRKLSKAQKAAWARGVYDNEERNRKIGEASTIRWQNKEYRDNQIEQYLISWQDEGRRQVASERMDMVWQDEEQRSIRIAAIRSVVCMDKYRENMSRVMRKVWANGGIEGEERSIKLSIAATRQWQDEEIRDKMIEVFCTIRGTLEYKQDCSKIMIERWRAGVFDGVFKNPSSIELLVANHLDHLKIKYVQQFRPNGMSRPFDFHFLNTSILLEVQGDYWHNLPGARERDRIKAEEATVLGYTVYEIWEHNLKELGLSVALEHILTEVNKQR